MNYPGNVYKYSSSVPLNYSLGKAIWNLPSSYSSLILVGMNIGALNASYNTIV